MRVGFASIYSWRPHVEQMYYLATLMRQDGHETRFLTCDSDLPTCYIRQMRPHRAGIVECTSCKLGGIRSYTSKNISSIGELAEAGSTAPAGTKDWVQSSASTLGRFESDADLLRPEFAAFAAALKPAAAKAYAAARAWIEREKLDGVFLFNGRIDATRAITEAAKDAGIPFVSMERTWLGDGLQLLPNENCLGLSAIDRMVGDWKDVPLLRSQSLTAASHIAARFLRRNQNEWRAYNVNAQKTPWPVEGSEHRILLLPGSRNETWGHPDWVDLWPDRLTAFDALIEHFGLKPQDIVLRCHPNWGEMIGRASGKMAEDYYTDWAKKRGIHCVASADKTSTMGLIEESDAIVVTGGSAALEAGALGKQILALSPSWYQKAGFQTTLYTPSDLAGQRLHKDLSEAERTAVARNIQKRTLRFCYNFNYRVIQFVPFVRCVTTTKYDYFDGADPEKLVRMLQTGALEADDDKFAPDDREENEILDLIESRAWKKLIQARPAPQTNRLDLHRRHVFQAVDWARDKLRRGDL